MKNHKLLFFIIVALFAVFISGCDKILDALNNASKRTQSGQNNIPDQHKDSVEPATDGQFKASSQKAIDVNELIARARQALIEKNYGQAEELAHSAVNAETKNAYALFVLAETQGAGGDTFGSLKSLDDALKNGFNNKKSIYSSEYLEKTRATAGFKELMAKYGYAHSSTTKRASKKVRYKSEDSIQAGDVRINMKEVFKDE